MIGRILRAVRRKAPADGAVSVSAPAHCWRCERTHEFVVTYVDQGGPRSLRVCGDHVNGTHQDAKRLAEGGAVTHSDVRPPATAIMRFEAMLEGETAT